MYSFHLRFIEGILLCWFLFKRNLEDSGKQREESCTSSLWGTFWKRSFFDASKLVTKLQTLSQQPLSSTLYVDLQHCDTSFVFVRAQLKLSLENFKNFLLNIGKSEWIAVNLWLTLRNWGSDEVIFKSLFFSVLIFEGLLSDNCLNKHKTRMEWKMNCCTVDVAAAKTMGLKASLKPVEHRTAPSHYYSRFAFG